MYTIYYSFYTLYIILIKQRTMYTHEWVRIMRDVDFFIPSRRKKRSEEVEEALYKIKSIYS